MVISASRMDVHVTCVAIAQTSFQKNINKFNKATSNLELARYNGWILPPERTSKTTALVSASVHAGVYQLKPEKTANKSNAYTMQTEDQSGIVKPGRTRTLSPIRRVTMCLFLC